MRLLLVFGDRADELFEVAEPRVTLRRVLLAQHVAVAAALEHRVRELVRGELVRVELQARDQLAKRGELVLGRGGEQAGFGERDVERLERAELALGSRAPSPHRPSCRRCRAAAR